MQMELIDAPLHISQYVSHIFEHKCYSRHEFNALTLQKLYYVVVEVIESECLTDFES